MLKKLEPRGNSAPPIPTPPCVRQAEGSVQNLSEHVLGIEMEAIRMEFFFQIRSDEWRGWDLRKKLMPGTIR